MVAFGQTGLNSIGIASVYWGISSTVHVVLAVIVWHWVFKITLLNY